MPSVTTRTLAVFLFVIALGSQSSLLCQNLHPRISYRIHVDAADLSGFAVEMRVRGAGDTNHRKLTVCFTRSANR